MTLTEHGHPIDGGVRTTCAECRRDAIDSNAIAEVAAGVIEQHGIFANLDLRYGIARVVLPIIRDREWAAVAAAFADVRRSEDGTA